MCRVSFSSNFSVSLLYCLSSVCPALKPAVYEEVQQTPSTKLKIEDQEVDVTRYILVAIKEKAVRECFNCYCSDTQRYMTIYVFLL